MAAINPFVLGRYESEQYFCDREKEIARLKEAFENQRNLTLVSPRRLGKTGLILHFANIIRKRKNIHFFYIDLMHTQNLEQFVVSFAKSIIGKYDSKITKLISAFSNIVKSLRPGISIDPMTGKPSIEINLQSGYSGEVSLKEIFAYLKSHNKKTIIVFDEFQQINNYPEKGTEALLRGHIQQTRNTSFVFSGSSRHMLMAMFGDSQRPFYQSTDFMDLAKINREKYKNFIRKKFEEGKRVIDTMSLDLILDLTESYTWYVQFLCNKLYSTNIKRIDNQLVVETLLNILNEQEFVFDNYRSLITAYQFDLLKAIAKEGEVKMPTSKDFIQKHRLSAASTIKTNLDSLINKEMILVTDEGYKVYDIFFSQWLKRL